MLNEKEYDHYIKLLGMKTKMVECQIKIHEHQIDIDAEAWEGINEHINIINEEIKILKLNLEAQRSVKSGVL